jgi:hypothetical protein
MSLAMSTTAGAGSLIIGVLLITLGLTMWFQQATRVFAGIASILLALVSLVVSNIGGFIIGFLLALVGGALALSWAPGNPAAEGAGPQGAEPAPTTDGAPEPAPGAVAGGPDLPHSWNEQAERGVPHADEAKDPNGVHRVG